MNFHPNKAEILEEFMFKIQNAHVPVEVLNTHIQAFKEHWGGKAAEFMDSIEHIRDIGSAQPTLTSICCCFKLGILHRKVETHQLMHL